MYLKRSLCMSLSVIEGWWGLCPWFRASIKWQFRRHYTKDRQTIEREESQLAKICLELSVYFSRHTIGYCSPVVSISLFCFWKDKLRFRGFPESCKLKLSVGIRDAVPKTPWRKIISPLVSCPWGGRIMSLCSFTGDEDVVVNL